MADVLAIVQVPELTYGVPVEEELSMPVPPVDVLIFPDVTYTEASISPPPDKLAQVSQALVVEFQTMTWPLLQLVGTGVGGRGGMAKTFMAIPRINKPKIIKRTFFMEVS
jgi:hypothetical protein